MMGAKAKFDVHVLCLDFFLAYLVSALEDLGNGNVVKTQLQFALGDTSDVEQIDNQRRLELNVAANDLQRLSNGLGIWDLSFQLSHHRNYRGERTAKLVRYKRQKLVFGGIC